MNSNVTDSVSFSLLTVSEMIRGAVSYVQFVLTVGVEICTLTVGHS